MINNNLLNDPMMGKEAKDKVTNFSGIIVTKLESLFGCTQYGIAPKIIDNKRGDTDYFDEGRIEIIGNGIRPEEVKGSHPGPDFNIDKPKQ